MELQELSNRLVKFNNLLPEFLFNSLQKALLDSKALIQNRVQTQGLNEDDNFFSDYSDYYKKVRDRNNLLSDKKVFSFTGDLWKSIGITFKDLTGNKVLLILEPKDAGNKKKLLSLEDSEGVDILVLSKDELKVIELTMQRRVIEFFNSIVG